MKMIDMLEDSYLKYSNHHMRTLMLSLLLLNLSVCSCNNRVSEADFHRRKDSVRSPQHDAQSMADTLVVAEISQEKITPVKGHRFLITGDFDGDGRQDVLKECYHSGFTNADTSKFYIGLSDFEQLVELTIAKNPVLFVVSESKAIDTLRISSGGQILGLSFLKNEGDLNGDGGDEISYVVDWADRSSVNTWTIVTYANGKWSEVYSFKIWDWQLPDLPGTLSQYGLFGLQEKLVIDPSDSLLASMDIEFRRFKGLVKKVSPSRIQVVCMNQEAEMDTMIVDLRGGKR